jgi:hypothetical protein
MRRISRSTHARRPPNAHIGVAEHERARQQAGTPLRNGWPGENAHGWPAPAAGLMRRVPVRRRGRHARSGRTGKKRRRYRPHGDPERLGTLLPAGFPLRFFFHLSLRLDQHIGPIPFIGRDGPPTTTLFLPGTLLSLIRGPPSLTDAEGIRAAILGGRPV